MLSDPGVVDDNVQPSKLVLRGIEKGRQLGMIGHIALDKMGNRFLLAIFFFKNKKKKWAGLRIYIRSSFIDTFVPCTLLLVKLLCQLLAAVDIDIAEDELGAVNSCSKK